MSEKVTFKYFEGRDAEQFTFYRIPKQLFTVNYFKGLSSDAKILYGLMLDRISLSVKNQWFDEENRAYIYFSIDEVMELLGCGKNKAIKCMKELDEETGIGLTQKRRQGFGRTNMIYVKTFLIEAPVQLLQGKQDKTREAALSCPSKINIEEISIDGGAIALYSDEEMDAKDDVAVEIEKKQTSTGISNVIFDPQKQTSLGYDMDRKTQGQTSVKSGQYPDRTDIPESILNQDAQISQKETAEQAVCQDIDENRVIPEALTVIDEKDQDTEKFDIQTNEDLGPDREVYIANFKRFKKQTSRSPENKLQEVYIWDPNNTEYNKTEDSDIKSYRILSGDTMSIGGRGCDEMRYNRKEQEYSAFLQEDRQGGISRTADRTEAVYALVRRNIELMDLLAARQSDKDLIMEIYSLIVEMLSCRSDEVVIASSRYPAEIVRSRFLKLRYDHILYVMDCLEKNTSKVKNIRKYLLAALFNAPATMDGYYRAEVRHDMAENTNGAFA